jgi:hypothetical protein
LQENENRNEEKQTAPPEIDCLITIRKYVGKTVKEQTKLQKHECVPGNYDL